jgi:predicted ester cyclase
MGRALQAYRRYRELASRGEFHRVSEVLDENWIENCLGLTGWTLGLDIALANLQAGFGQAFSDLEVTEHEVVEDGGDALVIRGQSSAVHTGRFLGVEPTGRRVSWEYLDMYRAGPDGRLNWHFLATDWNLVRLQLLGQAPDLPVTPTRRAVQAELAQHYSQPQN